MKIVPKETHFFFSLKNTHIFQAYTHCNWELIGEIKLPHGHNETPAPL